jgi:hypothetical protein
MNVSRNYLNKPHRIYGGEYPKGGAAIFLGHSPLWGGAIVLGYSSPGGGIPRNIAPFWEGGESPGGGDKSPVTMQWANSSTFLKILSCPPPNMSLPLKCPPKFRDLAPPLFTRCCRTWVVCLIYTVFISKFYLSVACGTHYFAHAHEKLWSYWKYFEETWSRQEFLLIFCNLAQFSYMF